MALAHFFRRSKALISVNPTTVTGIANFSSKSSPYVVKVGIPEFLSGIGKGLEAHAASLESEIGDFQKLLVTRSMKLSRIEPKIPCKHEMKRVVPESGYDLSGEIERKLILKYAHKYRLGLWRPRAVPVKS